MVEEEKLIIEANEPLSERMFEELFSAVHQAVGHVSMCWTNIDGAGTFDAKEAGDIALDLCNLIAEEMEREREMPHVDILKQIQSESILIAWKAI